MADGIAADRLARLGLTQYEARVYLALLRRAGSTPTEVARVARVPRPRTYDVLDSLRAKGLAAERPGRSAKFVATPPDQAAARLVAVHRERLEVLETDADALREELQPAYLEGSRHSDPLDYIELVRTPEEVAQRFKQLQQSVTAEMLVFSKAPYAVRVDANTAGMELAREHALRSVYELSVLEDPPQLAGVRQFLDAGEDMRFVEELPMKLGIIDERVVMLAMADPIAGDPSGDSALTLLVIEHPDLARSLKVVFEVSWSRGLTFAQACRKAGITP